MSEEQTIKVTVKVANNGTAEILDENGERIVNKTFGDERAAYRYMRRINKIAKRAVMSAE